MKKITLNFSVGIFILISIISIIFLSIKVSTKENFNLSKNNSYIVYANFNNIGSLKVSAPIKISGFTIGRVVNIALNSDNYQAVVTMSLNSEYHLTKDTSVQILTTGLLGEQYIAMQPGGNDEYLKNGDKITITSSALVLEELIGKFLTNFTK